MTLDCDRSYLWQFVSLVAKQKGHLHFIYMSSVLWLISIICYSKISSFMKMICIFSALCRFSRYISPMIDSAHFLSEACLMSDDNLVWDPDNESGIKLSLLRFTWSTSHLSDYLQSRVFTDQICVGPQWMCRICEDTSHHPEIRGLWCRDWGEGTLKHLWYENYYSGDEHINSCGRTEQSNNF